MMTGFMLPYDALEEYEELTDDQFGRLIRAGLKYAKDDTITKLDPPESYLFPGLKLKIIKDKEQYQRKCDQNSENARSRWQKESSGKKNKGGITRTKQLPTVNSDHIPSREEFDAYVREQGLQDYNPDDFWDYNSSRGWVISGEPVFDWKALFNKWCRKMQNEKQNEHSDNIETDQGTWKDRSLDIDKRIRLFRATGKQYLRVSDLNNQYEVDEFMRAGFKVLE